MYHHGIKYKQSISQTRDISFQYTSLSCWASCYFLYAMRTVNFVTLRKLNSITPKNDCPFMPFWNKRNATISFIGIALFTIANKWKIDKGRNQLILYTWPTVARKKSKARNAIDHHKMVTLRNSSPALPPKKKFLQLHMSLKETH